MQALSTQEAAIAAEIRAFLANRGFHACDSRGEIAALRRLAAELIPAEIAEVSVLEAIQRRTRLSLFLHRLDGQAAAFLAFFALSQAGERAITLGRFQGACVRPEWVGPFSTFTRAGYVWGLGGATRPAGFAAMRALRIMRERFFAGVRLYARATTGEGRKLMGAFGYGPAPHAPCDFLLAPPLCRSDAERAHERR